MAAETQPDGLASLNAQRNRARRSMPPPRHPISVEPRLRITATNEPPAPFTPQPAPTAAPLEQPAEAVALVPGETSAPVKVTLYVDRPSDEFMEAARVAGLLARPKVDISRSAVVRLAMRRLMEEMSPAEVKALLEQQEVGAGPGRKRR